MPMFNPPHPGEMLKTEILEFTNTSITKLAEHMDVSRKTISAIVNGRSPITPKIAVRLEKVLGNPSAEHWLRLQTAYDLSQTRKETKGLKLSRLDIAS
jgi:addiction module HigA family antidote